MDKEIKEKWVASLRSGKYRQARYSLRDENGSMCCLGVLCDTLFNDACAKQKDDGIQLLNEDFLKEIGMTVEEQEELSSMNDGTGKFMNAAKPFRKIANYIEENL